MAKSIVRYTFESKMFDFFFVCVPSGRPIYAASVLGSLLHLGLGLQLHWADTARDRLVVGEMSWAYFALGLCRFACPGIVN